MPDGFWMEQADGTQKWINRSHGPMIQPLGPFDVNDSDLASLAKTRAKVDEIIDWINSKS